MSTGVTQSNEKMDQRALLNDTRDAINEDHDRADSSHLQNDSMFKIEAQPFTSKMKIIDQEEKEEDDGES